MRFIDEIGFSLKPGQEQAFQQWLVKNEDALAKAYPKGSKYLGTFVVIYNAEKAGGDWRTLVEVDSYGTLDKVAAAGKDPKNELSRLTQEAVNFFDASPLAPQGRSLMKAVADATVFKSK
jgi:hypothetical protein